MRTASRKFSVGTLVLTMATAGLAQNSSRAFDSDSSKGSASKLSVTTTVADNSAASQSPPAARVTTALPASAGHSWEYGPFVDYGFGTGNRSQYKFFNAGLHAGKVLTSPAGPGMLRGQFEYAAEIMPFWQAYTPAAHLQTVTFQVGGATKTIEVPVGGGTFTGASVTPIILRWNLDGLASRRVLPWIQGAGGLIWTNHKFPPDYLLPHGQPGGTSVFNFTPQGGIGVHYFLRPGRSIDLSANAVHISSASLGDHNPGVNASVQFQVGYTWWK